MQPAWHSHSGPGEATADALVLTHRTGSVLIEELASGRRRVRVTPADRTAYVPNTQWTTAYPVDLVQEILDVKGTAWLCDEIMRDEDPGYVEACLGVDLRAYFGAGEPREGRVLDFGCGCGASTAVLARLLPDSEIVGVELLDRALSVAARRVAHHRLGNVRLFRSPNGSQLPPGIGRFDLVLLSGVFEHFLPSERRALMPQIWKLVRPGGTLFIDRVPNRSFPLELHTTRLPLINYLPAPLALRAARTFSGRVPRTMSWEELLRAGVRGATVKEIVRLLPEADGRPVILRPQHGGISDQVDLWYRGSRPRDGRLPGAARTAMKALRVVTGLSLVPYLTVAVRKRPSTR